MQANISLQILANFIHQIINPINGVIGTLDNIHDGTTKQEDILQRVNASRAQLEQIVSLIRNLDFFVKLSVDEEFKYDGKLSKKCIIPQVVIEAIQFYQESALQRDIHIEFLNKEDQFTVYGNHDLLRQVFMNIFDNSVKYSYEHSHVYISSRVKKKTQELIIEIKTNSVPFDNQNAESLFELGYRSGQAKEKISSGSGIGLYICKIIIEKVFFGKITMQYDQQHGICNTLIYFKEYKTND